MSLSSLQIALIAQAKSCADMGSDFTAQILKVIAKNVSCSGDVWELVTNWPGDESSAHDSVPLRLAGALHGLVLGGLDEGLSRIYPPNHNGIKGAQIWQVIEAAVARNSNYVLHRLQSAPQTNEMQRAGVLLPGFMEIANRTRQTNFVMSELGASAGLNLNWDRYFYQIADTQWGNADASTRLCPNWSGDLPDFQKITVVDRAGCDLNPIDLKEETQRKRLLSYVWADQEERLARTKSAIESCRKNEIFVEKMDAISWLEKRLSVQCEGAVHVIYNTVAWQYFPADKQAEGRALLQAAGARATSNAPLAWLSLEADGRTPGAALTLTLWPSGESQELARADFHGRWVNWGA